MNTRTATTVSKTFIPAGLKDSLKAAGNKKNNVSVVVFHDDTRSVCACDTRWSGGTRNEYYFWHFATESFISMSPAEGQELKVQPGGAIVVLANFCGQSLVPQIYVRNADLVRFFLKADVADMIGYTADEMPAEVAGDWLDERADELKPRLSPKTFKAVKAAADAMRLLTGVGAHAA